MALTEEDLFDMGEGRTVRQKTITQLMNGYGELYSKVEGIKNKRMMRPVLDRMNACYLEVHRRVLRESRRQGGTEKGSSFDSQ